MLIHLHEQATYHGAAGDCAAICREGTQKVRSAIQASDDAGTGFAEGFGVTPQTIYKWRKRNSVADHSHTPHRELCLILGDAA